MLGCVVRLIEVAVFSDKTFWFLGLGFDVFLLNAGFQFLQVIGVFARLYESSFEVSVFAYVL